MDTRRAADRGLGPRAGDVKLPAIFGDHMVLQRDQKDRVWGRADPGEEVTVTIARPEQDGHGRRRRQVAGHARPAPAGGPYTLTVKGKNTVKFNDVLVGEVWICSGQSNMQWSVATANDADLEITAAKFPRIRLITVPKVGTQEPQKDFHGQVEGLHAGDRAAASRPSAIFFGRQLHQTLDVPVGLINDAWGGSACEAWIRRDCSPPTRSTSP